MKVIDHLLDHFSTTANVQRMLDFSAALSSSDDASTFDSDLFSPSSCSPVPATTTESRRQDFHSIDAERNRARFYRLIETNNLFGEPCLVIEYGRIGTDLCKRRVEYFGDSFARAVRFGELVRLRKTHGYSLVHAA